MKKYRQAVSALVLRPAAVCSPDGCDVYEILIVHKPRRSDAWQLPQGGIEEGETPEQAAIRELQEETGLTFDRVHSVSDSIYAYDFPPSFVTRYQPVNSGQQLCFVVFTTTRDTPVTVDRDEIDAFKWVLPEEIPKYVERKQYLDVIAKVYGEATERLKNSKQ